MSLGDLLLRTELLLNKYGKYDVSDVNVADITTGDPFMDEYALVMGNVADLAKRAEDIAAEKNRAVRATLNAEMRRAKATLRDDVTQRLQKTVNKPRGVPQEIVQDRTRKIAAALAAIDAIPDGVSMLRKPMPVDTFAAAGPKSPTPAVEINVDVGFDHRQQQDFYYQHSQSTMAFTEAWQASKARQDKQLDNIERGLETLRGLGEAMGENLQGQEVLANDVEDKLDEVSKALRTNNAKLKGLVTKVRSTKMFIIDTILLCVLLGLALYIYNVVKK